MNEYKLMIAPFNHNGFRSLSKKQAEEYFHWYVGQSKARIEQLYGYAQSTGSEENSTMDFTLVDCFLNNLLSEI